MLLASAPVGRAIGLGRAVLNESRKGLAEAAWANGHYAVGAELWRRGRLQMGPAGVTLFAAWLALMVAVPHAARSGVASALPVAVSLAVAAQTGLVLRLLLSTWRPRKVIAVCAAALALAWCLEYAGLRTGWPFGEYAYTKWLGPRIGGVPVQVPAAWLMMLPLGWGVAETVTGYLDDARAPGRSWRRFAAFALISGLAVTAWDLFLDPQMVAWNAWQWKTPGVYFGIPMLNFAGWTCAAALITSVLFLFMKPKALPIESLLAVYTATWLLETVGLAFFFGLPAAAAAGFAAMGGFAAAAWLSHLRRWK